MKACFLDASLSRLVDLLLSNLFLDAHLLLAHLVLLCHELHVLLVALLVVHRLHLCLRCLLLAVHENCLLDFSLLLLRLLAVLLVLLHNLLVGEHFVLHPVGLHFCLFVLPLLQSHNLTSTLLGLFNLFPGALFFLLEKGNAVGEQLGITLNTKLYNGLAYSSRSFLATNADLLTGCDFPRCE